MQLIYKSRTFDIVVNIDHNLIIATYVDPQKISYTKDEQSGQITKTIGYSDIISASIPISDSYISGEDNSKLFENNDLCFSQIFHKLCQELDNRLK